LIQAGAARRIGPDFSGGGKAGDHDDEDDYCGTGNPLAEEDHTEALKEML
jgi:hypothetical protein